MSPRSVPVGARTGRLTRRGYGALAVGAVAAGLGLQLGYPGVAAFGLAVLGLVMVAVIALRRPPTFEVRRETSPASPERLAECAVTVTVINRGRNPAELAATELLDGTETSIVASHLPPTGRTRVTYPVATARRGPRTIGPLWIERAGLAGLAIGRTTWPASPVLVRPRVLPVTVAAPVTVLLDDRAASYPADTHDFDEAVDVAASLVASAVRAGYPFVLRTPSVGVLAESPRKPSIEATTGVLTALARLPAVTATGAVRSAGRPVADWQPQGLVLAVTGSTADLTPLVRQLADAGVLLILDTRPEWTVAQAGAVALLRSPRAEDLLYAWDAHVRPAVA